MLAMTRRKLKKPYTATLPRRSVGQVLGSFETELTRQANVRAVKFFEVKVTGEALMNAILLHFLDLPQDERDEAVDRFVGEFEQMIGDEEMPANEEAPGRSGAEGEVNRVGTSRAVPSVSPRRKRPDNRKGTG